MCPSFMVTREEKHSTRGRARLLFEMMSGHLARRLARPARQGRPGPVPVLQGLQGRLPGDGGHGHLQGRIPVPLLRAPAAAPAGLRARVDPCLGPAGLPRARPGQRGDSRAAARLAGQAGRRGGTRAARRRASPARPSATGSPGTSPGRGDRGAAVARYVHRTTSPPRSGSPRSVSWRRPASGCGYRSAPCAAAARSTTTGCCPRPGAGCAASWPSSATRFEAGLPVIGLEPSCLAVFRDELRNLFPADTDAHPAGRAERDARRVPDRPRLRAPAPGPLGAGAGALPPRRGPRLRQREGASPADGA